MQVFIYTIKKNNFNYNIIKMWYTSLDDWKFSESINSENPYERTDTKGRVMFVKTFSQKIKKFAIPKVTAPFDLMFVPKSNEGTLVVVEIKDRNYNSDFLIKKGVMLEYQKNINLYDYYIHSKTKCNVIYAVHTSDDRWLLYNLSYRYELANTSDVGNVDYTYVCRSTVENKGYINKPVIYLDFLDGIDMMI